MKAIRYSEDEYKAILGRRGERIICTYTSPPKTPPRAQKRPTKALAGITHTFPGLPPAVMEYRFMPPRKFRFDYAWPDPWMVALEVEGGIWTQGRHVRGKGYLSDLLKYNEAAIRGWKVLRCTPDQLKSGEIMPYLKRALSAD